MENLLCDERWLSSPVTPIDHHHHQSSEMISSYPGSFYTTKEESEEALAIYLEKEITYIPQPNYVDHLRSEKFTSARYRATQWLFRVSFSILENHFHAFHHFDIYIYTEPVLSPTDLLFGHVCLHAVKKSVESLF